MNTNQDILDYKVNLSQYKLLAGISEEYLPFVLDDIFSIGYNTWVKNFIRNDLSSQNQESNNNITESKLTSKGQHGENIVIDILKDKFPDYQIENTSKMSHSGDIQVTTNNKIKIIVEVKNYNKTIDQEQIDKLKFDMKFTGINLAILVSLNSGIVGKKRFEIESFYYGKTFNYIIYVPYSMHKFIPNKKNIISHNNLDDSIYNLGLKIEYTLSLITSLGENMFSSLDKKYISNKNINQLVEQFEKFYYEFKTVKYSYIKLEENIKKSLESHQTIIKDYELSIKSNINNLISKKFNENIFNIINQDSNTISKIEKITIKNINNDNNIFNQEIYLSNYLIGKIIKITNSYDLLLEYQNQTVNEFFTNYDECLTFINSVIS